MNGGRVLRQRIPTQATTLELGGRRVVKGERMLAVLPLADAVKSKRGAEGRNIDSNSTLSLQFTHLLKSVHEFLPVCQLPVVHVGELDAVTLNVPHRLLHLATHLLRFVQTGHEVCREEQNAVKRAALLTAPCFVCCPSVASNTVHAWTMQTYPHVLF